MTGSLATVCERLENPCVFPRHRVIIFVVVVAVVVVPNGVKTLRHSLPSTEPEHFRKKETNFRSLTAPFVYFEFHRTLFKHCGFSTRERGSIKRTVRLSRRLKEGRGSRLPIIAPSWGVKRLFRWFSNYTVRGGCFAFLLSATNFDRYEVYFSNMCSRHQIIILATIFRIAGSGLAGTGNFLFCTIIILIACTVFDGSSFNGVWDNNIKKSFIEMSYIWSWNLFEEVSFLMVRGLNSAIWGGNIPYSLLFVRMAWKGVVLQSFFFFKFYTSATSFWIVIIIIDRKIIKLIWMLEKVQNNTRICFYDRTFCSYYYYTVHRNQQNCT